MTCLSMASEEQLALSSLIKSVHQQLRNSSIESSDPEQVWREHLQNHELLNQYAKAMQKLATRYWDKNMQITSKKANCRIDWVVNSCREYFMLGSNSLLYLFRDKEDQIMKIINESHDYKHSAYLISNIKLLDVGSCYNPFSAFPEFEVTAIDIAPAQETVELCDFLEVSLVDVKPVSSRPIEHLVRSYYDAVVFSLLLEYLPASEQRLKCCLKAYDVLKPEGILLIITPDSRHQGANAKLMKNWRFTLGLMGFTRIKLEKLEHVTCMVFRKAIFREVPERWCRIHKEGYMEPVLCIPQDYNNSSLSVSNVTDNIEQHRDNDETKIKDMFRGLPFVDDEIG
ncbi:S-adenosylmethionine sensor upstream of mTORC1-like [Wyeomyia smithii]|uniref:S-adenosylmethionine sensor upstream of mTORC1-like n=1 Tax=Wyeomyia smithii TaxID=174621 RepID=UPI002467B3BC|nr:S-adenosylmethionine sensor upstream of mTORC1-like [Wyeomyia smithii]